MKTIKILTIALMALFAQMSIVAQNATMHKGHPMTKQTITTSTFKVWGNCEMCKARIEGAAKSIGATKAIWSDKTKMLTVSYDAGKVKLTDIHKKIAAAGHDTDKARASDKSYKALPGCCQYERGK